MSYQAEFLDDYQPDGLEYYRVESWYKTPWGDDVAPKEVILGWGEKEADKIRMTLPDPCAKGAIIIGSKDAPRLEQVWKRQEIPEMWTYQSLAEKAESDFKHLNKDVRKDWWKENATQAMTDYADKQWDMRWNGVFVWINGRLTWLPGTYWMWLQWVKINGNHPQYLDVQLRLAYVVEWSFVHDRKNYGVLWLKRRRIGGSMYFMWVALDFVMKWRNTFAGLQGNTESEIAKDFERKMVPMWKNMPAFFRTQNEGTDNPKSGFRFKTPAKGGHKKFSGDDGDFGNESYVELAATKVKGKETFDRERLDVWYRDEWAKSQSDVYAAFLEIMRTFEDMGRIIGRALMPSTAGESSNANVAIAEEMWFHSVLSLREISGGTTTSGLVAYFTPAYDSLFIEDISFIGPWGEGVIGKPTPEEFEYLCRMQPENRDHFERGGSWHWLRRKFNSLDARARQAFKRQYPSSPRDAFKPAAGSAHINPAKVGDVRDRLSISEMNVKYHEKLTIKCSIKPEGMTPGEKTSPMAILSQRQVLVADPAGDWLVRADFFYSHNTDWKSNQVIRGYDHGNKRQQVAPSPAGKKFSLGIDPIDKDKDAVSTSKGLSDMAITVFWKYDATIDAGKMPGETRTYSPVMHYVKRDPSQKVMHLELAKAMILTGSMAHIENTRGTACMDFLRDHGLGGMILPRPLNTFTAAAKAAGNLKRVPGTPASDDLYNIGIHDYVNEWVTEWASAENCPFMALWDDFKDVDPKYMQPYDSFVSFMFALLDAAGGVVSAPEKNAYISAAEEEMKAAGKNGSYTPSTHDVNEYRIRPQ